jgi:hypothetical protein
LLTQVHLLFTIVETRVNFAGKSVADIATNNWSLNSCMVTSVLRGFYCWLLKTWYWTLFFAGLNISTDIRSCMIYSLLI